MGTIQKREGKNGASYRCLVRLKGAQPVCASFTRLTDAKRWVQQTEADIRHGRHFPSIESKRKTLADLIDRYIAESMPTRRSVRTPLRTLKWWCAQLGYLPLSDVTTARVKEEWDKLIVDDSDPESPRRRSPRTMNAYLETLSAALTHAVREYGWLQTNPVKNIRKKALPKGRTRFLSEAELERFLAAVEASTNPCLKVAVYLSLATGGRKSEVLGLRWHDIDLKAGRVTFTQTKNNDVRSVAIRGKALEVVREHARVRRIDTNLVFPPSRHRRRGGSSSYSTPWEDLTRPFLRAVAKADIENFRWHDMRHTAASYLLACGASLLEIGEVLGHRTAQMTKRYAHLAQTRADELVEKMVNTFLA